MGDRFANLTRVVSSAAGSWQASLFSFLVVLTWTLGGFYYGFSSEIYQLVINTFTTICTFLMVFLIQGAQNRSEKALQLKLNEMLRAIEAADNKLIDIEHDTEQNLEAAQKEVVDRKGEC